MNHSWQPGQESQQQVQPEVTVDFASRNQHSNRWAEEGHQKQGAGPDRRTTATVAHSCGGGGSGKSGCTKAGGAGGLRWIVLPLL